jgi:succinate-acetate transporter protein
MDDGIYTSEKPNALGDPAALGFAGFAVTTALLSAYYAGRIHSGALTWVGMALFYGGIAQFLSGMWEYRRGNTFLATVFGSFGAFWMGLGIMQVFDVLGHLRSPMFGGDGITWLWFCWAIIVTLMWVAAFRTNGAVWLALLLWAATFWALWIGTLVGDLPGVGWTALGGWLGWATSVVAGYTAFAEMINSTFGKVVLPEFPTTRVRTMAR